MLGTSDQSCWLAEACKILLLLLQAAEEERGLNEAQQAAEDEEALRAMREEGMLTDQPDSGVPKPGVPFLTLSFDSVTTSGIVFSQRERKAPGGEGGELSETFIMLSFICDSCLL